MNLRIWKNNIRKKRTFTQPVREVWGAISKRQKLEEWFLENTFSTVEGKAFEFFDKPGEKWKGVYQCEILSVQPPYNLAYTWAHNKLKFTTYVWWRLDTLNGNTVLELEHSGFKGLSGLISLFYYSHFWDLKLKSLLVYLSKQKDAVYI
ncbi:MAG: SRPBCC domain-containing protein [Bacteroidetes bacterium]|nr:SRPBCC domain-containing protein [Bacteroidota bacterium]